MHSLSKSSAGNPPLAPSGHPTAPPTPSFSQLAPLDTPTVATHPCPIPHLPLPRSFFDVNDNSLLLSAQASHHINHTIQNSWAMLTIKCYPVPSTSSFIFAILNTSLTTYASQQMNLFSAPLQPPALGSIQGAHPAAISPPPRPGISPKTLSGRAVFAFTMFSTVLRTLCLGTQDNSLVLP